MLCPIHGIVSKVPGADGFPSRLGAAQIGKWSCGQENSNSGAKAGNLSGLFCCFSCLVSPLLGCPSLFCGLFCCEEGGTLMSVDGQEFSSLRRLLLPFEQPLAPGLATTTCAVLTLLGSRFVPDTSVPKPRAGTFDPSGLATGSTRD